MVGVRITTSTRSGPTNTSGSPTSRAFIAGVTERGSLTPVSVRSIVAYESEFGVSTSYAAHMWRAAQTFFEEGGSELVVCRAVGANNTVGAHTFKDTTPVTALDTLTIKAANPGSWSSGLTVQIEAGRVANTRTISAFLGGQRVVYLRDKATVADIVSALANNPYIRGEDKGAASAYPTRLPAIIVPTALTAGDDQRSSLLAADVAAALDNAGDSYGAGAVATPGYPADTVGTLLIAHAKAHRRIAILAGLVDDVIDDLSASAGSLQADGEYAGLFTPWLAIPDGSGSVQVSPEGYVLGVRARVMNAEGFWQAPAGNRAAARFVQGTVAPYDPAGIDDLADARVSGITRIANNTVLYGWRSLSLNTDQYSLLNARDFLNTLTELVETALQPFVFETIDATGQLVGRIHGALVGVLQPIQDAGGISAKFDVDGNEINPAYRVQVSVLNETTISCTIVVRMSGSAETIEVSIVKAAFNATV